MTDSLKQKEKVDIIRILYIVLGLYNVFFIWAKYLPSYCPSFLVSLQRMINEEKGLFTFLELLAVAVIFVDMIVYYDNFPEKMRKRRLFITVILTLLFLGKFALGLFDSLLLEELEP